VSEGFPEGCRKPVPNQSTDSMGPVGPSVHGHEKTCATYADHEAWRSMDNPRFFLGVQKFGSPKNASKYSPERRFNPIGIDDRVKIGYKIIQMFDTKHI
jgi:hypothetical protein